MLANLDTLAQLSEADFRKRFPNYSPPEDIKTEHVIDYGFAVVEQDPAPALAAGETMEPGALRLEGERVLQAWVVVPASETAVVAMFEQAVQARLNSTAFSRGYDSIATAISYAEEPAVPKFQNDGKAFRAWRSLVWAYAYEQLAAVKAGDRTQPTVEDFLLELPELELPV